MTVRQLKDLYASGPAGEVAATSYVNGGIDAALGLDLVLRNEGHPPQWCAFDKGRKPVKHPAYRTAEFLRGWEKSRKPMSDPAADFVIAILDNFYRDCE
jgi:hypothetical protein